MRLHAFELPMSLIHLVILALVQGITEFLPISSSAHLILVPDVLGAADQASPPTQ